MAWARKTKIGSRGGKYGSQRAEWGGRKYHSTLEARKAMWLHNLVALGLVSEIKEQHKIVIKVNGKPITTHIVDFLVTLPDGRQKYVEIKGFPTDLWAMKRKLVEATESIEYLVNPTEKQLLM